MCSSGTFYTNYIIPFHSSYMNGLRWSIDIPVGSTITSAYLKLRCKDADSGVVTSKAEIFDEDSCAAFTAIFWTRAVMAGFVDIYINPTWAVGVWYTSLNIASLVQSFIDRAGYSPGNYLGLRVWYRTGTVDTYPRAYYYDATPADAAKLEVTWTLPPITKTLTESLGLVDVHSRTWNAYRTYTELLGLVDTISKDVTLHPLTETLGLLDTVLKSTSITRTELLGLKDYISKGVSLHPLTEVLGLSDYLVYVYNPTILAKLIAKYIRLEDVAGD